MERAEDELGRMREILGVEAFYFRQLGPMLRGGKGGMDDEKGD